MGYTTILDIIGSVIIGGLIMLILFRMSDAASQNTYNNSQELVVQTNLTTIVGILENDFRRIGYCKLYNKIPISNTAIISADSTSISFLTDTKNNGDVDTSSYYVGPTSELSATPNPNDRLLYRVVNNETPKSINVGLTEFKLLYFDTWGDTLSFPITTTKAITSIQISIQIEDAEAYGNEYVSAFWRQIRLAARNLTNR